MNTIDEQQPAAPALEAVEAVAANSTAPAPIGERLREARERAGFGRDEFSRRAHIPSGVLADLESGRLDRLGAPVFLRGYLRSYARAAGLPDDAFSDAAPATHADAPPLVATRIAPATPRWVARYATPVAYALLTAVVMVPLVYLARPTAQQMAQAPSLTPIDVTVATPPHVADVARAGAGPTVPSLDAALLAIGPPAAEAALELQAAAPAPSPVMASLAPIPQQERIAGQRVVLRLAAASWVEFTGADGSRLEYALLPAGTLREYRLTGSAELRLGNASRAQLTVEGRDIDLAPLSSANDVAKIQLGVTPARAD